jgi:hypothetical protein
MVVTNMKQLLVYAEQQKKLRASEHRRKHAHDGKCSGLTQSEYNKMTVRQKTTFSKARKFTHNRMWRDNTKKFTVEQLKLIKTL